ncbi:MAG: hypothetical protein JW958_10245 [Candidatus Eisenbacteria bacterium]|nr:hypothetical protein [Candidatus Eisenbacteria bacterium]
MSHRITCCLLGLVIALAVSFAAAPVAAGEATEAESLLVQDPDNLSLLIRAGNACLAEARAGDGEALKRAEKHLDKALGQAPDDPWVLVLHGSMLALKGRDAMLPIMKMRHVKDGLKEMDRAVELAPMDFGIRYQRGAFCLNLPVIFERAGTAVDDFEQLLMMAEHAPGSVSEGEVLGIKLNLARARMQNGNAGDARSLLEGILAGSPDSASASEAKALLAEIDE